MAEAEKKDIARLDFKIDDAINKLTAVENKLKEVADNSKIFTKTISNNIKDGLNVGENINTTEVQNKLNTITGYTTQFGKKMKYTLSGTADFSKMIDIKKFAKDFENLKSIGVSGAKQITITQLKENARLATHKKKNLDDINTYERKANVKTLTNEAITADKIKVIDAEITRNRLREEEKRKTMTEKYNLQQINSTKTIYDKISEYAKTYVIYQGFNQLRQAAADTIEEMKNVEYRMMEISRIMEEGTIDVNQYRDALIQLAYQYGRSFDDVSTVTLNFARAGYNAQDSLAMTEQALLALNTAELDAEQATEGLISILAQWDMNTGTTAEKSENLANVIDKINKTADKFPISSEGLLEALQRTSQGFNLAGATIDETIAMIVAAETASQRGGKTIGTAMSNMQQQLKAEGKLDLAKTLGLELFEDEAETQFKSITEIFSLMSERMTELEEAGKGSSTEMQSLLELFTVFRRNIGAGLLSEMSGEDSTYMKALTNSLESAGYSAQENAKYMGTMEAATQQLNATILELQSTLYDEGGRSIFTGFILGAEGGVNAINSLIKNFGVLPTTISAATLAFGLFSKNMNYNGLKKYSLKLKETASAIKLYNQAVVKGENTAKEFNDIMGDDIPKSLKKYTLSLDGGTASMKGYIANTIKATTKQIALNVVVAAGEAALSFGLSVAIQAIVGVINDWVNATDKAVESVAEMNDNLDETSSELEDYANKVESLRTEIASESTTQEEANAMRKELLEIQDELISKYGEEAKSINLVTGEINEQKEAIQALAKENYKKYIQENQKEINKLAEKFQKEFVDTFTISGIGYTEGKFSKDLAKMIEDIGGTSSIRSGIATIEIGGNSEEILEKYRNLYDKINEYAETASGVEADYAKHSLEVVSGQIKKMEEEYSDDFKIYQEYLNNKLQYDVRYEKEYGKILEARADLSKAIAGGNQSDIDAAQEKLNVAYINAINKAITDPNVSDGMVKLLEEQVKNMNKSTEREQVKLRIGVEGDELFESIQDVISDMGDISFKDLEEGLKAEELTGNMKNLKEILEQNGVTVNDFITNFEYLGFTMGTVAEEVESAADTLGYLQEQSENSINKLVALDAGFTSVYTAMNEFNENGYITGTTLQNLINNDLLQYFDVVNGKLAINEASMVNAATATKAKAIYDLQAKAAAEIAAIAFETEETAVDTAKDSTAAMTQKTKEVQAALTNMTPEALKAANAWTQLNAAMGGSLEGLTDNQINDINAIMNNLSRSITAVNSVKIEAVSYRRATAKSSGSSSKSDAERAAQEAAKAAEEAYKARLEAFEDYIDETERLEKRWVDKQKDLGQLTNKDYMYIMQQRIERYKKYIEEVKKATWMSEEDRLKLIKEYSEKIEDYQVDYLGYLEDQLEDEIDALEKATDEKIKLIEEEADARIAALDKVTEATDRLRETEDYENERQSILEEISYWEQRTGREAQEALKEAKEKLAELDAEWEDTQEDWSIEDQIKQIEEERDAQIKSLEEQRDAEIAAMQEVYDAKVKMFAETGQIIYEEGVIQSQALYEAYKNNFIDPIMTDLKKLRSSSTASSTSTTEKQYETYTIQYGDTLSKIAQRFGTTVQKIMDANPYITNKNKIFAGKTLQIPKFHEGGIVGGNQEAFALLKPHEVVLKPEWADGINKLAKMARNQQNPINNNSTVIEVKGDLVRIDANIKDKTDAEYLTRRIEKTLKEKFNIKK